jgi:hypothetical protein
MKFINLKVALLCAVWSTLLSTGAFASGLSLHSDDELTAPEVPCPQINVPEGNKVAFRAYASGVQVYWWNGTNWGFVVPLADLFASPNFQGKVGRHYGGPTWRSNSGSLVIGRKLASCAVDSGSIPWLLLVAEETDGDGIFRDVTYVQRVKTVGGLVPAMPGSYDGQEVSVPYTAEYYFYKKSGS